MNVVGPCLVGFYLCQRRCIAVAAASTANATRTAPLARGIGALAFRTATSRRALVRTRAQPTTMQVGTGQRLDKNSPEKAERTRDGGARVPKGVEKARGKATRDKML